jgi:hypothetical protein
LFNAIDKEKNLQAEKICKLKLIELLAVDTVLFRVRVSPYCTLAAGLTNHALKIGTDRSPLTDIINEN